MTRYAFVASLALVGGCLDGTTPAPPDPDPLPNPYLRSARGVRVNGTTKILVIPTMFADGRAAPALPAMVELAMFGNASSGPVSRVFRLASGDKFALRGEVAPWVRTSVTSASQALVGTQGRTRLADHVIESIQGVDPGVDFGAFDNDGPDGAPNSGDDDGVTDGGVVIVHSEFDLGCHGGTGKGPHPHAASAPAGWMKTLDTLRTQDPRAGGGFIGVAGYTIMGVMECSGATVNQRTLTHELGHMLFGLPDLYHAAAPSPPNQRWVGRRWVVGCWELMSAGSGWGCGSGEPAHGPGWNATLGAWARQFVGWTTPTVVDVTQPGYHDLKAPARGEVVLKLPISASEYVLVEYREQVTGDLGIPASGVLMYHITESLPYFPDPAGPRQYRVALIEADDDSALVRIDAEGGDRGVAADAFGNGVNAWGPATHSSARSADGLTLPFSIEQITIDKALGTARVFIKPAGP